MLKRTETGSTVSTLLIIVLTLCLLGTVAAAFWAFTERQDYKNNSDKKAAQAVAESEEAINKELQAKFAEEAKNPFKTYTSSSTYGSVKFKYPKTWSAYVEEASSSTPLSGYFHPNQVPGIKNETAYALRVEVLNESYSNVLQSYESQISKGELKASAFIPPAMKDRDDVQPGTKLTGQIDKDKSGSAVVIKVRDKTLKVSTESPSFSKDFNTIILSSLSFSP